MSETELDDERRGQQARELIALAPTVRPAVVAVIEVTVASARAVLAMPAADPDEVWAATVVNVADAMGLDLEREGQLSAAIAVTELVMRQAGES